MESVRPSRVILVIVYAAGVLAAACSPEADRVRDGGLGGDPGNSRLVQVRNPNPVAADTTLWPGLAPTPLERLENGNMYPPRPPVPTGQVPAAGAPSSPEKGAFDRSAADPRRPESR